MQTCSMETQVLLPCLRRAGSCSHHRNVCSHSAFIVQEDLPGVESAIFQSVIQESLHDIGGEKGTSYQPEPSDDISRCMHM